MPSRQALALMSGDPGGAGSAFVGDPGIFGSIFRSVGSMAVSSIPGVGPAARIGGGAIGRAVGRSARVLRTPAGAGAAGGVVGAGIGALKQAFGGVSGGGFGHLDGYVTILSRTGRPVKIITPQGRMVNLRRRSRGISASALRGAFRLARIAHQFGGVARTGRRARSRK